MKCPYENNLGFCRQAGLVKCVGADQCIFLNQETQNKIRELQSEIDRVKAENDDLKKQIEAESIISYGYKDELDRINRITPDEIMKIIREHYYDKTRPYGVYGKNYVKCECGEAILKYINWMKGGN